jgi:hypothetical protein
MVAPYPLSVPSAFAAHEFTRECAQTRSSTGAKKRHDTSTKQLQLMLHKGVEVEKGCESDGVRERGWLLTVAVAQ